MRDASRRSLARRAITTALAFGIAGCAFQPHVEPLQIPTVPAQAFSGTLSPSEAATQPPAPDVPSPGEPGFDPDDPEAWIAAIEERWPNVDVVVCDALEFVEGCVSWTAEEAGLLYDTLREHILSQYLDGHITFIRTQGEEWQGLMRPGWSDGQPTSEIWIDSDAWRAPPAAGLLDFFDPLFRRPEYFQGIIAHELTHAAVRFHPGLLDLWIEAQEAAGVDLEPGDWRVGLLYVWSYYDEFQDDPALYEELTEGELFAMTIAALMYDPWLSQGID